jgi:hypothetical protein
MTTVPSVVIIGAMTIITTVSHLEARAIRHGAVEVVEGLGIVVEVKEVLVIVVEVKEVLSAAEASEALAIAGAMDTVIVAEIAAVLAIAAAVLAIVAAAEAKEAKQLVPTAPHLGVVATCRVHQVNEVVSVTAGVDMAIVEDTTVVTEVVMIVVKGVVMIEAIVEDSGIVAIVEGSEIGEGVHATATLSEAVRIIFVPLVVGQRLLQNAPV